jgi:hypothetical protein
MQNDYEEPTPKLNETVQLPVIVYCARSAITEILLLIAAVEFALMHY